MIMRQLGLATGVLTSNRKGVGYQLWRGSSWVPLLGAIGRYCWLPLLECRHAGLLLGAIARCHCWMPLLGCYCWSAIAGCHHACHCWVPLLGCHGWMLASAIARCHCWVPLRESHCWVPLREKIGQSDTPFHTNWLVLSGVYAGIILWTSAAIIYGQCSPPDPNHPRVPRASVETDTKNHRQAGTVAKKKPWKLKGCLLSLPHFFQEHHEEKTQEEDKN